ncbi:hypothetical protein ACFE04_029001 [Oxalis oulophora]
MKLSKDPAIKLFGTQIHVPAHSTTTATATATQISTKYQILDSNSDVANQKAEKPHVDHSAERVTANCKPKEDQLEIDGSDQAKEFKKPDKIVPCPRCNSLETKFCYFNNYNVNQPRHFCKNCQRYWTAGGTMRNVPIGAGRRKNKQFASQYRQIVVSSDGIPISSLENQEPSNQQLLPTGESVGNGTVLKFGPETPLCHSMETTLNLGDQKVFVETGFTKEPSSSESSMMSSGIRVNELPAKVLQTGLPGPSNEVNTSHSVPVYPVPPWMVPWNPGSAQAGVPNGNTANGVQWCPTPMLALPGFCPPNIPLQFVPASYWGCMPVWTPGAGNMPLSGSNGCLSPSSTNSNSCCSGNGSPTLGKHSREPTFMDEEQSGKCILVPKTLRIDDPDEAAKSPLWASLGIRPDQKDGSKGTIFRGLESKTEGKNHVQNSSPILEANPAALSRVYAFQDGT